MIAKREHDHDDHHDHDDRRDHDNDNGRAVAPAPSGGALTSLEALGKTLNVDMTSVIGGAGTPMLSFKRDGNGTWMYGQKRTVVEDGSSWAVNPLTFKRGYICFSNDNRVVGEHLLFVGQPMPDITELPDKGFEWHVQWAVGLKCTNGTDAGTEVVYKPTTVGGIQAIAGLLEKVRDRLNGGQHDGKVSPIVNLEKDNYQNSQYGKIWIPVLTVVDWMPLSGPAPAPAPASPPPPVSPPPATTAAEQPRRRRVA
jgi:hypothetical protein